MERLYSPPGNRLYSEEVESVGWNDRFGGWKVGKELLRGRRDGLVRHWAYCHESQCAGFDAFLIRQKAMEQIESTTLERKSGKPMTSVGRMV